MESERSGIPGSSDQSQGSSDAKREGKRSPELAGIQKYQRSTKISRPCQLLQEVHKRLHQNSSTTTYAGQEGVEIKVGKGAGAGV